MVLLRQQITHLLGRQSPSRRLPTLLIQGETGTGKGLLARAAHNTSSRSSQPFIDADCVAIPETLLEAELLPRAFQAKLLKVVEERGVRRLGSTHVDMLDLWVIAATNVDLGAATRDGSFREDLYHRLAAMTIYMPPLRERGTDILLLAGYYLSRACAEYHLPLKVLTKEAQAALMAYSWPGNVRELANMLERVALLSGDASVITPDLLGLHPHPEPAKGLREPARSHLKVSVEGFEREKLRVVLQDTGWNISLAAARLGLPRNTLRYRIAKLELHPRKTLVLLAPGRKQLGRIGDESGKGGPNGSPSTEVATWPPRRAIYLSASVSEESADPDEVSRLLESVADKVRRFGGRVEVMTRADLLASFGFDDSTHEAPACAANVALSVQKTVARRYASGSSRALTVQFTLRASKAQLRDVDGPPEANKAWLRLDGDVTGILPGQAEPPAILVAADAARLFRAQFELEPVAASEEELYRLIGRRQSGRHGLPEASAPFVGREHELAILDGLLDLVEQGRGQAVGIVGEPGVGKSRLLHEFRQRAVQRGFVFREARCFPSSGAMSHDALHQMLQQAYEIGDDDSPEAICEKIRQGVEDAGLDPDEWAPYLLRAAGISSGTERLAGLSREVIKLRTAEVLRRITVERSRNAPLVLAFDDLHLAGRPAEEFLLQINHELPCSRVLLLATYRPGYRLPWGDRPYVTQFGLQPLSRGKSWTLLCHILPIEQQPMNVIPQILDSARGNPLFLEELARDAAGKPGEEGTRRVPDALQEALLSQTSRLSDGARRLLAFVSVIGDRAPLRLVDRLMVRPRGLAPLLAELRKHEILHEKSARGEMLFFDHRMMSLAVYESLPVGERQRLHAAVGAALEELHAGKLQDVYHLLAYHYGRSADSAKAIAYLPYLFQKTGQNCTLLEVVAALERALEHAARLPAGAQRDRLMIDLVTREAHALEKLGRLEGARDLLLRHLQWAESLDSPQLAGPFFLALAGAYGFLGEAVPAEIWVRRAAKEAGRSGDVTALSRAGDGLTLDWLWAGRFIEGIEDGGPAVTRPGKRREREWTGQAVWGQGMNCVVIGQLNRAIELEDTAWEAARGAGDTRLECFAAFTKGWAHTLRGDWLKGLAACRRAVELAPDPLAAALAKAWLGGVCVEMEDWEQATFALFHAYDRFLAWKCRPSLALVCAWLSEALLGRGQLQRAEELAGEGLALSEEFGFPFTQALARRALGRIARARDAREESEGHFQTAYKGFQSLGAAYEGARTLLDLAALADASGRPEVAAIHLATARKAFSDLGVAFYATRPVVLPGSRQGAAAQD